MNLFDVATLKDDDKIVITGRDLKVITQKTLMLTEGLAPKENMTLVWASQLASIITSAELLDKPLFEAATFKGRRK